MAANTTFESENGDSGQVDPADVHLESETGAAAASDAPMPSTISSGTVFPSSLLATASGDVTEQKKDFESISLEECRKPRRIIHFSDGVIEEYSTDEEDGEKEELLMESAVDPKTLTWMPYIWHYIATASWKTYKVCDYMGEKLAYFFGITSPKYAYALSEYNRLEEEERKELDQQIAEKEEERDRVARVAADKAYAATMQNQPEPGLPTSTH